jgi:hypothetical protein
MAGRISRWNGKRIRKAETAKLNRTLEADTYWTVKPGDNAGEIIFGIISQSGKPAARVFTEEEISEIVSALNDELWSDSMRGELPEGVVSDE